MGFQSFYTKVIGKECQNPECESFRHRMPRKSSPICSECDFPMTDVRKLSYPKIFLPPFLVLLLMLFSYAPDLTFLGLSIENRGFIVILDISGSMSDAIQIARREAISILEHHRKKWGFLSRYGDVIYFDEQAYSALGSIRKLDERVVGQLKHSLNQTWSGGGTCLNSAITLAASEVVAYGKPTTLLILTDGKDGSIPEMIEHLGKTKALFQGTKVLVHSTTPRIIFSSVPTKTPVNEAERNLRYFSKLFDGNFGSTSQTSGCGSITAILR